MRTLVQIPPQKTEPTLTALSEGVRFGTSGLIDCELIIPAYSHFTILVEYSDNWGGPGGVFNE